jgi:hypothetical protein
MRCRTAGVARGIVVKFSFAGFQFSESLDAEDAEGAGEIKSLLGE